MKSLQRKVNEMKRLITLAAIVAVVLVAGAPAQATSLAAAEDQYGTTICVDGVDGGVCYDPNEPITCDSFTLKEEAQAFLDLGLGSESDREVLDPDGNGIACDDPKDTIPDEPNDKSEVPKSSAGQFIAAGMDVLPETGGAAVLSLGAGVLLVVAGLLLRRIVR